ncbi:MAG: hypothetical protein ACD_63C00105G0002 [uncultured bacterium]|nr:MAG: hypothetical protein ACD_63C00105G0002 [uncultured bacterium]
MAKKHWKIAEIVPKDFLSKFPEYPPIVAQLLFNRKIKTQKEIDEFLNPDYEQDLHDPFLMLDMEKAVVRIIEALEKNEKILVHGDYDADGVSGAVILYEILKDLGMDVEVFLPSRQEGGYGMNSNAIKSFKKSGVQLIVSVDCGVTNVDEVAFANKLGMEVIVTDHHTIPPKLPDAFAIVNPSREDDKYPFKKLSGVGVVFKLVQALQKKLPKNLSFKKSEKWFLDLVAVGTVADCTPIIGENRTLVKYGLQVLEKTKRLGLLHIMKRSGVRRDNLDTYDIGFRIGPRLNAAGRLRHADIAFDLLTTKSEEKAVELSDNLDIINRERQVLTGRIMEEAEAQLGEVTDDKRILVAYGESWPSGVVGLVAGKLCERHSRPVLVLEKKERHSIGAARSIPKFNIIEAIRTCSDILEKHGGHSQAAGCTISNEYLETFANRLQKFASKKLLVQDLKRELFIDAKLDSKDVSWDLHDYVEMFAPFGLENEKPRFVVERLKVAGVRAVGNMGKHLKLDLQSTGSDSRRFPAIGFGFGDLVSKINFGDIVDVAFELEANEWNGARSLQLKVADIRSSLR